MILRIRRISSPSTAHVSIAEGHIDVFCPGAIERDSVVRFEKDELVCEGGSLWKYFLPFVGRVSISEEV